jgi:hypothetical protein
MADRWERSRLKSAAEDGNVLVRAGGDKGARHAENDNAVQRVLAAARHRCQMNSEML